MRLREITMPNDPNEIHPILGIPWKKVPRHIAIIMDGNGRWAQDRGLPRLKGHAMGSKAVRETITECAILGIECLTLYSFSTENWKRPPEEIAGLMALYEQYLVEERPTIMKHNIRVRHLGFEKDLFPGVLNELRETVRLSRNNTGMTLCLALNYSGRSELIAAIQNIASHAASKTLDPSSIDEDFISHSLDTKGLPDPDLLLRTSGEYRVSNFLLWQLAYAEFVVVKEHWPDFDHKVLHRAILEYSQRNRRFGGLASK